MTKPITLDVLQHYFRSLDAGDVPDPAQALYSYLRMDGFIPAQPAPAEQTLGIELNGVAEQLADNAGAWRSCSGCHNLNEGHPTGPWSDALKCHIGMGCSECGGIGAVWDNTDYADMANAMAAEDVHTPDLRKLAVEIVDGIRGYTFEFSSHPAAHRDDYDFIEKKLRAAIAATSEGGE